MNMRRTVIKATALTALLVSLVEFFSKMNGVLKAPDELRGNDLSPAPGVKSSSGTLTADSGLCPPASGVLSAEEEKKRGVAFIDCNGIYQ